MSASSKGKPKAPTNTVSDAPPIASSSSTPTRPRPDTRGGDDPHPAKRARIATAPNPSRARKSKTTDIPSPCTSIQKNRLPLASRLNSAHPSLEELQMPDADASPLHKDSVLEPSNVGLAETDITRLSAAAARTELPGDIEMSDTGFFPLHEMSKLAKLNSAVPFVNPCRAETDQDVEMLVTDSLPLHETRNTLSEPLLPAWNPEKDAASTSLSNKRTGSTPGEEHRNEQMNTELENVELTVSDVHQTPKRVIVKTKRRSDRAGVKTQSRPHHLDWTQGGLVQVIPTGVTHVDKVIGGLPRGQLLRCIVAALRDAETPIRQEFQRFLASIQTRVPGQFRQVIAYLACDESPQNFMFGQAAAPRGQDPYEGIISTDFPKTFRELIDQLLQCRTKFDFEGLTLVALLNPARLFRTNADAQEFRGVVKQLLALDIASPKPFFDCDESQRIHQTVLLGTDFQDKKFCSYQLSVDGWNLNQLLVSTDKESLDIVW